MTLRRFRNVVCTLLAVGFLSHPGPAEGHCYHHKPCWKRVHLARAKDWLWRHYKAHPMPWCTWGPESGPGNPWKRSRYRVKNWSSTAAGKFQMLDQSAHAAGIPDYPGTHDAARATPLAQERAARVLYRMQGPRAWVGC